MPMRELFELHADMCKVFSNATRLEILNLLRNKEISVSQLVEKTGLSQANVSQHLAVMKNKGIVQSSRKGKNVYYRLVNQKIVQAFDLIREVLAEKLEKDRKLVRGA